MIEELCVLLLGGHVARVEQNRESERLEVVHVPLPGGVVKLHLNVKKSVK